ncbi:MAG: LytTR family DNA-binding domain-containing protein [Hespellia sp.]|nr:LytTR family DNA-binding domain-containing protein [Hespellia sp.]
MEDIRIAICDDEKIAREHLKRMVENILIQKELAGDITSYCSGVELINSDLSFDILFLDIEMPDLDGIDIGKILCDRNSKCKIVMATGRVERFKEAFMIEAYRFVTKPFDELEIEEVIETYLIQQIGLSKIVVYDKRIKYQFVQKQIEYVRAYNGYSELLIQDNVYRVEESLNSLEQSLDSRCFVRVNKEYCVNLFFVSDYHLGKLYIEGKELLVSRRRKKAFEKKIMEFGINYR